MQWHEFIFSEQRKHKLLRHLVFWTSWWLYFLFCYILLRQTPRNLNIKPFFQTPGDHLPLKTFLLVLLFVIACYPMIYFLLPKIIKGKWIQGIVYLILLCILVFIASDLLYWEIFPFIDSAWGSSIASNPAYPFLACHQSWANEFCQGGDSSSNYQVY